ncbi:hypothetical protein XcuCFBP2542_16395, partial [Xanthomonas cucurbitae]
MIDKDVSANRLYLPVDGKLADEVETSPHRGRTRRSYTDLISPIPQPRKLLAMRKTRSGQGLQRISAV